ncbi:tetrathionate reductase subunit TtrA [Vibrio sp. S11_S32]|nr:tetrathionate reductase subunit TtrA [Vibrio sp. S11_S32]
MDGRSTACARGNAMMDVQNSPYRVTQPLKRVGKRGEGKWQPISFEQLVTEVVEGGDLFGEGHVDGLKAIRDLNTPLDVKNPEYGPLANQLLVTNSTNEGRDDILKRFAFNSFGTRNFANHGSYCGYVFRAASGAFLNDLDKFLNLKPDYEHVEFALFIGTAPAQSGNPFKRQARQLAKARTRDNFDYAVVTPVLPMTSSLAAGHNNQWVPTKPASDSALVFAMMQWMFTHDRYNKDYLAQVSHEAMQATGNAHWCNATHLVITQAGHAREGSMLRASDIGLPFNGEARSDSDPYVVVNQATGELVANTLAQPARLLVEQTLDTKLGHLSVASSLQKLKHSAFEHNMQEWSDLCEVPVDKIIELADKFTSHGHKAVVDTHGGNMHANGFYNGYTILMLNAMVGNINKKGGMMAKAGGWPTSGAGPRYDFTQFKGKVAPKGVFLSRSKFPYEKTTEYKNKVAAGQSPYPTRAPWYPISAPLLTEHLTAAMDGYPYRLKAWINHMGNPLLDSV